jgi:hypothetical protein
MSRTRQRPTPHAQRIRLQAPVSGTAGFSGAWGNFHGFATGGTPTLRAWKLRYNALRVSPTRDCSARVARIPAGSRSLPLPRPGRVHAFLHREGASGALPRLAGPCGVEEGAAGAMVSFMVIRAVALRAKGQ